jgi:PhoPQ-activated pathogenicity-related protein
MMWRAFARLSLVAVGVLLLGHGAPAVVAAEALTGPLADYVARPDDSYAWKIRREGTVAGTQYVELTLTSQTWHDVVWKHQLFILRPKSVAADAKHALLFIGGGAWKKELAEPPTDDKLPGEARTLALVAENLRTPVAVLLHVPQQPLFGGLTEDELIALTFEKRLRGGDADWPLLLPMVKSAVRGMDAVQAACKQQWQLDVQTFTVSGASKRGWTTWLTGAVDPRAVALAPMVIDVLNMGPQMKHQRATWGDLSDEVGDYKERGLDRALETPAGQELAKIVDPYAYRDRLTQPKLIILGTNDRYWPLDALNLYWDGLPGSKHVLYVPNNGHGLKDLPRMVGAVHALQQQIIADKRLPKLTWRHEVADGKLSLAFSSDRLPAGARAWIATSATKDFREAKWNAVELTAAKELAHAIELPRAGYAAMFGEFEFNDLQVPYFLSSQVRIVGADDKAK